MVETKTEAKYQADGDKNLCLQHQAGDSGNLHQARTKDTIGDVEFYQDRTKEAVKTGRKPKDRDMFPYMAVREELGVVEELLCRGERIVILEGRHEKNNWELRDWVVDT